jgi:hypothetical protein
MSTTNYEPTEDLPQLTDPEARFVTARCQGCTITEAYCVAFPGIVDSIAPHLVAKRAWSLSRKARIQTWLSAMQRIRAVRVNESVDDHLATLAEIRDEAREAGQHGAAVAAQAQIGKALGHGERAGPSLEGRDLDHAIIGTIAKVLGDKFAAAAADKLGLPAPNVQDGRRNPLPTTPSSETPAHVEAVSVDGSDRRRE